MAGAVTRDGSSMRFDKYGQAKVPRQSSRNKGQGSR
jgi:hypothetical protein